VMRYILGWGNVCERDGLKFDKTYVNEILVTRIGIHNQIGSSPYPPLHPVPQSKCIIGWAMRG
jgi:hypothetical protein